MSTVSTMNNISTMSNVKHSKYEVPPIAQKYLWKTQYDSQIVLDLLWLSCYSWGMKQREFKAGQRLWSPIFRCMVTVLAVNYDNHELLVDFDDSIFSRDFISMKSVKLEES